MLCVGGGVIVVEDVVVVLGSWFVCVNAVLLIVCEKCDFQGVTMGCDDMCYTRGFLPLPSASG